MPVPYAIPRRLQAGRGPSSPHLRSAPARSHVQGARRRKIRSEFQVPRRPCLGQESGFRHPVAELGQIPCGRATPYPITFLTQSLRGVGYEQPCSRHKTIESLPTKIPVRRFNRSVRPCNVAALTKSAHMFRKPFRALLHRVRWHERRDNPCPKLVEKIVLKDNNQAAARHAIEIQPGRHHSEFAEFSQWNPVRASNGIAAPGTRP